MQHNRLFFIGYIGIRYSVATTRRGTRARGDDSTRIRARARVGIDHTASDGVINEVNGLPTDQCHRPDNTHFIQVDGGGGGGGGWLTGGGVSSHRASRVGKNT